MFTIFVNIVAEMWLYVHRRPESWQRAKFQVGMVDASNKTDRYGLDLVWVDPVSAREVEIS